MVVFFPFYDKAINILYIEERFTKHLELKKTYVYKTRYSLLDKGLKPNNKQSV